MWYDDRNEAIPIYTTSGDWACLLMYPNLFNQVGEWIGWVTAEKDVYSVEGRYVGFLDDEPRILRRRVDKFDMPKKTPPQQPERISAPAFVPLPPFFRELPFGIIDVIDEDPDILHPIDTGEFREDME